MSVAAAHKRVSMLLPALDDSLKRWRITQYKIYNLSCEACNMADENCVEYISGLNALASFTSRDI